LAEAIAENEFAAHRRVQAAVGGDVERLGLLRMLGTQSDEGVILSVFPWRGEQVRMALPTQLPPTLGSWAQKRARGETEGARLWDRSVPQRACQQRGRFLRSALRGALVGLSTLHASGLLHQSLSPAAVLLSSEDDREGGTVRGTLSELGFCRDAPSLSAAYRTSDEGEELAMYEGRSDPLGSGLLERAVLKTRRPGDPTERAAFGRADDVREFGVLCLEAFILGNAPPDAPLSPSKLRALCDGPFAASDEFGGRTDGVDVQGLRGYLDAEPGLRLGGVGGVDVLDVSGGSGWELLAAMLSAEWEHRPSAEEALQHRFWEATLVI
jgi:serine/threonine protein kinase